jgi:vancomycin resistance protein YoaR
VPPGRDATVVFGGPDLRFRNTLSEPVTIRAEAGSRLTLRIIGSRRDRSQFRIVVDTTDAVRPVRGHGESRNTRYCTATVWREELRDGQAVGRELISSDTYRTEVGS